MSLMNYINMSSNTPCENLSLADHASETASGYFLLKKAGPTRRVQFKLHFAFDNFTSLDLDGISEEDLDIYFHDLAAFFEFIRQTHSLGPYRLVEIVLNDEYYRHVSELPFDPNG